MSYVATHRAPSTGLPTWDQPDASRPPGPQLPPLPDWIAAAEGPGLETLLERITRLRRPEPGRPEPV